MVGFWFWKTLHDFTYSVLGARTVERGEDLDEDQWSPLILELKSSTISALSSGCHWPRNHLLNPPHLFCVPWIFPYHDFSPLSLITRLIQGRQLPGFNKADRISFRMDYEDLCHWRFHHLRKALIKAEPGKRERGQSRPCWGGVVWLLMVNSSLKDSENV